MLWGCGQLGTEAHASRRARRRRAQRWRPQWRPHIQRVKLNWATCPSPPAGRRPQRGAVQRCCVRASVVRGVRPGVRAAGDARARGAGLSRRPWGRRPHSGEEPSIPGRRTRPPWTRGVPRRTRPRCSPAACIMPSRPERLLDLLQRVAAACAVPGGAPGAGGAAPPPCRRAVAPPRRRAAPGGRGRRSRRRRARPPQAARVHVRGALGCRQQAGGRWPAGRRPRRRRRTRPAAPAAMRRRRRRAYRARSAARAACRA